MVKDGARQSHSFVKRVFDFGVLYEHHGVLACLEVAKCFNKAIASESLGRVHEESCLGPDLCHSVIVLTESPGKHQRAHLVKERKVESQRIRDVLLEHL